MTSSALRAVLGIDAAWTETQPSGVALAVETENGWRLAAVEASYDHFLERASGDAPAEDRPRGSKPNAGELLAAASRICGRRIDLVAVDMPLSRQRVEGRRDCDNEISSEFGAKGAATHSPSPERPGKISDHLCAEFEANGYRLCTALPAHGLIEVYPHPALIEFLKAGYRLEYKAAKASKYWPELSIEKRQSELRLLWARIVESMEPRIEGVRAALPPPWAHRPAAHVPGWRLKAYEDKLDAVVCAAVAIAALHGKAEPYGDEDAAIWVPVGESGRQD